MLVCPKPSSCWLQQQQQLLKVLDSLLACLLESLHSLPAMSRTAIYQIDFSAVAAGKRVAASKRRIRW